MEGRISREFASFESAQLLTSIRMLLATLNYVDITLDEA